MASSYIWFIWPNPDADLPHKWTRWLRVVVAALLVFLAATAWYNRATLHRMATCNAGGPSTATWAAGDNCVGLSEGPYAFDLPAFAGVMQVIARQNDSSGAQCPGTPVTVGVLLTMTDEQAGGRAVHELEGMATAQRRANGTGCIHPIRLVVGNLGDYNGSGDALAVARELAARGDVVAVAGVGLSQQTTADIADHLAQQKIPMVSDVVTAEGFDQTGSHQDTPDFASCDSDITYPRGVGKGYFYRVAFRAAKQVDQITAALPDPPDFIAVPTGGSDPYTCTALPLIHRAYGNDVPEVKFDSAEPTTVPHTARRICATPADSTVIYLARGRDLGRLLYSFDEAYSNGQCAAPSVTVVSTSDGNRMRTVEADPALEDLRNQALRSDALRDGRIRLLFTMVSGEASMQSDNPNWADFSEAFRAAGFDLAHADDGWAINAYDALTTVATAVQALPANQAVQSSEVNTVISGFTDPEHAVPGAGGPIVFDNSGNRTDPGPAVVRVCPPATGSDTISYVPVVVAEPGKPMPECAA
ncbi:ABC transporter substrate-binding protein [Nocardia sp. NPDC051750]|uniref:ABC transporter substrate-binding protein n=1 Tax=Nocardia sp. NPDC051750 TaxID=3364325 RepID=UPI0037B6D7E9